MKDREDTIEFQRRLARQFRALHALGNFFVMPNAWDVPSARIFEEAGFNSVATSSAGLSVSMGYPDGEGMPLFELVAAVRRMSRTLSIPLSVDMVSGFGNSVEEVAASVRKVIEAGAVGINIEDFDHREKRLFDPVQQADKISAIVSLREEIGIPFVINARTDAVSSGQPKDPEERLERAVKRSEKYIEAGADCVYPMGVGDYDSIKHFADSVQFPVNLMIRKGLPEIKILKQLGVTRLSFGPAASNAALGLLWRIGKDIIERGSTGLLLEGAIDFETLNSLALRRK